MELKKQRKLERIVGDFCVLGIFYAKVLYIPFSLSLITMKFENLIPKNVDPIKLADEIKGDLTAEFIKRMKKIEPKVPLVLQSR